MIKSRLALAGILLALTACAVPPPAASRPAQNDWQTYTSEDAAYAFDYPAGADITTSDDASLKYKLVFVQFPISSTNDYEGATVMVLDNPGGMSAQNMLASRYAAQSVATPDVTQSAFTVNGRQAIKLERDAVIGDGDKYTCAGRRQWCDLPHQPVWRRRGRSKQSRRQKCRALFDRLVQSFRVLDQPLQPKSTRSLPESIGGSCC